MPTRIIREGILTSEAINSLSDSAELFYRRLMSVADDYGRFHANPAILRAHCYPLKLDKIREADVKQLLSECLKRGVVFIYGAGKYLQIDKFRQQTRSKSKFPEPAANELLIKCESVALGVGVGVGVGDVVGAGVRSSPRSDEEFIKTLTSDATYEGIDVRREFGKMAAWCTVRKVKPTQRRFVNWLNKCDKPFKPANNHQKSESIIFMEHWTKDKAPRREQFDTDSIFDTYFEGWKKHFKIA